LTEELNSSVNFCWNNAKANMSTTIYLTEDELNQAHRLLNQYPEAQAGVEVLKRHRGNPKTSVEELAEIRPFQGQSLVAPQKSIWDILLEQLYLDICGSDRDSLRKTFNEARLHPNSSALLTGLVVYVVHISGLAINPAIAAILVLYVLHLGVNVFCEYTAQFRPAPPRSVSPNPLNQA
jgi:hypothetical protein